MGQLVGLVALVVASLALVVLAGAAVSVARNVRAVRVEVEGLKLAKLRKGLVPWLELTGKFAAYKLKMDKLGDEYLHGLEVGAGVHGRQAQEEQFVGAPRVAVGTGGDAHDGVS